MRPTASTSARYSYSESLTATTAVWFNCCQHQILEQLWSAPQALLERANSPYSQLLATTTLTKLVSRTAQVLSLQQRIDIRKS